MKMSHKKRTLWNCILTAGIFLLFLVSFWAALEDRMFKAWKTDNQTLFLSFSWVKSWGQMNLPVNSKILIDYSQQKKIAEPFKPTLAGKMRFSLYLILYPEMKRHILDADVSAPDFRIEQINQSKNYIRSNMAHTEDLEGIDPINFSEFKRIMEEYGIDYFIYHFLNYRQERRIQDSIGFYLLYSNPRFMLLSLKKPEKGLE